METRGAPRVAVDFKISFQVNSLDAQKFYLANKGKFGGRIFSISIIGVGMSCDKMLPSGLILDLDIDGKPFLFNGVMSIKGEVRYCRQVVLSQYNCGIKFLDLSNEYKNKISSFVATHRKSSRMA